MPARTRPARRAIALLAVAAVSAITTSTVVGTGSTASAAPGPANVFTSGHARFEVLSPTLIRTEYSDDGTFTDAPTFNAIGRDAFGATTATSSTTDGWLTITTGKATLKYKVDSGRFNADNLVLTEQAGQQPVTAAPWAGRSAPTCAVGALCETEDLLLTSLGTATDHTGYTGTGFAAGFEATGASMTFATTAASAGTYDLALRSANNKDGSAHTLSVSVDGAPAGQISIPFTGSWDAWQVGRKQLTLTAGEHTITVSHQPGDTAQVNVDSLAVQAGGSTTYPAPTPVAAASCAYGAVCEAESVQLTKPARPATDHNGYSGTSFVAGLDIGAAVTTHVTGVPSAGSYDLQLRYASGTGNTRPVSIKVGDGAATAVPLPGTPSWDSWRTISIPVTLTAGADDVTVQCPDSSSCGVNIDTVAVTATGAPALVPHAPLGGYRRGLDGVDGATTTTPGLLYQDGWYLLDDTASAVFDSAKRTVTARTHTGSYQDGYVFAYGQDYTRALQDLATLTGPSKLLPRWAYGVWYSEYYDRAASDYQNTILPKFRSEGVPLDGLVTDTDFKSPDRWDGWEMDKTRFPDPKAYFDWAHSQGLHTSLNIHPSVLDSDPKYAAAQATAKNGLTRNDSGCYSDIAHSAACYVFDWSNPDQLKAYFDLHDEIKAAGNDIWWLDWCCEQSAASMSGVTPDAWINQHYAWYSDDTQGRGFALSRAFGSLQAGGYSGQQGLPTGPWADKRTTAHFTGDTTSSWGTLAMEVGYTPGEAASTGLSAVSHDIGGFNSANGDQAGAEPGSKKLPDDLYARWVQLGAFQPILRLHGNHSDRLPWQYGAEAKKSAEAFLNLRENLVPYTYTLSQQAATTGVPVTRPLYLQYPGSPEAYTNASSEYLYGPDVLVAPVTQSGMGSVDTRVWFPPGSSWTDWFTGKTYAGGTTTTVSSTLATMPVFVRSGGIVTTRSDDVTNDVQNPLSKVTVQVASGADGSSSLFEDDGTTTDATKSATTAITYTEQGDVHSLQIAAAKGAFTGQVASRQWTVEFTNADAPKAVSVDGTKLAAGAWSYDAATRTVTATLPARPVGTATTISWTARNTAPTSPATTVTTHAGKPVAIALAASDADGDALTYTCTAPSHGTVTGSGPALTYTPAATYVGTDAFTCTVTDTSGGTATVAVTVSVTNQAPTAVKIHKKTTVGTKVAVRLKGSDPDADPLTYTHTKAKHGKVSGSGSTLHYKPARGFRGTDTFTWTVTDPFGASATKTVKITVTRGGRR